MRKKRTEQIKQWNNKKRSNEDGIGKRRIRQRKNDKKRMWEDNEVKKRGRIKNKKISKEDNGGESGGAEQAEEERQ